MRGIVRPLADGGVVRAAGTKAVSLSKLDRWGFTIPAGWYLPFSVHDGYRAEGRSAVDGLRDELRTVLDPRRAYAVRSAADIEDARDGSFAGQFETVLSVTGVDAVIEAVLEVLASADSPKIRAYLDRIGREPGGIRMSVIIQEMVEPELSGVAFSRHPVTGMDEVAVEAVRGTADTILQGGADPFRWVHKWGAFKEVPDLHEWDDLIRDVVRQTRAVEKRYRAPVDVEWAFDGETLYLLQARPVRADDTINLYSNRISKEMLPGSIKPLIWSINIPMVNGAWIEFLERLTGSSGLRPEDLARQFSYRAYFNIRALGAVIRKLGMPEESLEIMLGMSGGDDRPSMMPSIKAVRYLPRLVVFLMSLIGYRRKTRKVIVRSEVEYRTIAGFVPARLSTDEKLAVIDRLRTVNRKLVIYDIVIPLLMNVFNMLLKRKAERAGIAYGDIPLRTGEADRFDPEVSMRRIRSLFAELPEDTRGAVLREPAAAGAARTRGSFEEAYDEFLDRFGHLSDSGNDFSKTTWRELPDVTLRMILDSETRPNAAGNQADREAEVPKRLRHAVERARRSLQMREEVSYTYTRGYGLFRPFFLSLGEDLAARGSLASPEDIFYLTISEVRDAAAGRLESGEAMRTSASRREEMVICRDADLPETIFGDDPPPPEPAGRSGARFIGTGTSRGYYRGRAAIIRSTAQFGEFEDGDVLVIPYSDVSWAPLFAKAGAVVAESGGMLSHSSIIAREYRIPCVVAVKEAMRIPPGSVVTVDGFSGEIRLERGES